MLHVGPLNQSDLGVKLPSAEWILEGLSVLKEPKFCSYVTRSTFSNGVGPQTSGVLKWTEKNVPTTPTAVLMLPQLYVLQSVAMSVSSGWPPWVTASGCCDRWSRSSPCHSKT